MSRLIASIALALPAVLFTAATATTGNTEGNMGYIDAHCHVWTDDTDTYPLAQGYSKADMKPARFTPEDLLAHARPSGVTRINLIQMSYYTGTSSGIGNRFDNSYMLDMIAKYKGTFTGTAVIDPAGEAPERLMTELAGRGVRSFRIYPGLEKKTRPNEGAGTRWLEHPGYAKMFAAGARNNQALACLINPGALDEIDRMCRQYPDTPVIIDHLCRIGVDGVIRDSEVNALCALARHKRVMVKVGAFYALGAKKAPYTDLGPLIERVVKAYGANRCMWESDCPFQVAQGHTYRDSLELIRTKLNFLSAEDRDWLLRKTAEQFFFRP
jgi:predicted TIM-barrel fold metal-dependent hydrolase